MATTKVVLTSSWQILASDGFNFLIDNQSTANAQITFQTSTPAVDAPYHVLAPGEGIIRMDIAGNVYGRDLEGDANAYLIVTS